MLEQAAKQQRTARRHSAHRARCTVCRHPEKFRIELLLASGASIEALARKFGLSGDAIGRHWRNHVDDQAKVGHLAGVANLEKLAEKAAEQGSSVLDYLAIARNAILTQLGVVQLAGDARTVGYLAIALARISEIEGKITGEIVTAAGTVNVTANVQMVASHPDFLKMQAAMFKVLQAHPRAREDMVRVFARPRRGRRATGRRCAYKWLSRTGGCACFVSLPTAWPALSTRSSLPWPAALRRIHGRRTCSDRRPGARCCSVRVNRAKAQ
jgi:hypothetical protein